MNHCAFFGPPRRAGYRPGRRAARFDRGVARPLARLGTPRRLVVDGGFTRGTAVLKGLALGAAVVAVGRTVLWGLAADGAAGVACALDILRRALRTTMALAGQTSVKNLVRDLAFRVD